MISLSLSKATDTMIARIICALLQRLVAKFVSL